jgi:ribosomal protein L37AE/L43A
VEYLEEEKAEEIETENLQHYICSICKSGLDEDHIYICDGCDKAFHSNCHKPQIDIEDMDNEDEWYCAECN